MKKLIITASVTAALTIGALSAAAISEIVKVRTVDYPLIYGRERNSELMHPLLSFNDTTYMSVRDFAKMFGREVIWEEEDKSILIVERNEREDIIKDTDTALAMGKAILNEYFGESIGPDAIYSAIYTEGGLYYMNLWLVSVIYEPDEKEYSDLDIALEADAHVDIEPTSGRFMINGYHARRGANTLF